MKIALVCEHDEAPTILEHIRRGLAHERVRATVREPQLDPTIVHLRCMSEAVVGIESCMPNVLFVAESSLALGSLTRDLSKVESHFPGSLFEWDSVVMLKSTQSSIYSCIEMLDESQICRLSIITCCLLQAEEASFEFVRALCQARTSFQSRACRRQPWHDRFTLLPTAARRVVERVLVEPSKWTVKRLCAEMHAERRTIERWFKRAGLPSPAGLIASVQAASSSVRQKKAWPREN